MRASRKVNVEYDPGAFPPFAVTVDIALFSVREGRLCVLLVDRGVEPFKGALALPGGFLKANESTDVAAHRELREETNVDALGYLEQLKTYSSPDRDPRMRVVSVAYFGLLADVATPLGGDDAAGAAFYPVERFVGRRAATLAFDHGVILQDALERVRSKLEYSALATSLLPHPFTIAELRGVYEAVWDVSLHPANFRRKVLSTSGLVVRAPGSRQSPRGGPAAELYTPGDADQLQPALLRP